MINSGKYDVVYSEPEGKPLSDVWYIPFINPVSHERTGFNSQKPEKLIKRLLEIFTDQNDLVLDFFMGSGTTATVAHKINRRYISIEQIESQTKIALERLINTIDGNNIGISKDVNWQGGGSFVYCELLEDNNSYIKVLEEASTSKQIREILSKATANGKIVPSVLPSDLTDTAEDFSELSIEEQRNIVLELLDKNKLYVNLSDLEDEGYDISESDKIFTRSFYQKLRSKSYE